MWLNVGTVSEEVVTVTCFVRICDLVTWPASFGNISPIAHALFGSVCCSLVSFLFGRLGWLVSLCLEEPFGVLLWFSTCVFIPVLRVFGCWNFVKAEHKLFCLAAGQIVGHL